MEGWDVGIVEDWVKIITPPNHLFFLPRYRNDVLLGFLPAGRRASRNGWNF